MVKQKRKTMLVPYYENHRIEIISESECWDGALLCNCNGMEVAIPENLIEWRSSEQ